LGQHQKNISGYLLAQYNQTIHDRTKGNNPWGMGLSFQLFFNNHSRIRPTIDINQSWTGKISYINIFNRDFITKEDFSSISFSIGKKLF